MHSDGMKLAFCLLLLAAPWIRADEAEDLTAIGQLFTTLNKAIAASDLKIAAGLFEPASVTAVERFTSNRRPWSETTPPRLAITSIRFASSDLAIVDAESTQFGSVVIKSTTPVLIVLQRKNTDWKIAAFRPFPVAVTPVIVP
jgi:hypothetical protein